MTAAPDEPMMNDAASPRRAAVGVILAVAAASILFRILKYGHLEHSSLLFIGIPTFLAIFMVAVVGPARTTTGLILKAITIALLVSGIFLGEGFICILMASPIFMLVGVIIGQIAQSDYWRHTRHGRRIMSVTVLPILIFGSMEGVLPGFEFPREESVTVSRIVAVNADSVRASLARTPRFAAPLPLFFRLRFPRPAQATGSGLAIGDTRAILFTHAGHHPGTLSFRVSSAGENSVTFTAVSDDSYLHHWLMWRGSDVTWSAIDATHTRVTWTSRYRRTLDPAWYFAPWERYGMKLAADYLITTAATGELSAAMDRTDLLLAGTLYLPAAVAGVLWFWRPPSARARAGIVFATIWCAVALVPVQMTAVRFGWWSFTPGAAGLFGMPTELQLGWALYWGMVLALALPRAPLAIVAPLMLLLDAWLMPMLVPAITLGPMWLAGDAIAVSVCLVPAQLLFRWTRDDDLLVARAGLIAASFVGLMFGILPTVILRETGGSWAAIAARPFWITSLLLQVLAIPAAFGMSAVQEFVTRGGGTPVPFDATRRLVTSGPYAYVANPMQLSNSLLLLSAGALLSSWWIAAAGVMSVIYSAGLAAWDERSDLGTRFGEPWIEYRRAVRAWFPRWRPYATPGRRAILYVAEECGKCSEVARWFAARAPVGLEIIAAERHPTRDLWRVTYDPGDGSGEEQGAAAVARALEHVNLAWATLGIIIRMPVLNQVIQAFVDASGGGPQRIARCNISSAPEAAA